MKGIEPLSKQPSNETTENVPCAADGEVWRSVGINNRASIG